MKGISHFVSGIAAASCFPAAIDAAGSGNPFYILLGGFCGLLPDTLDFKFIRYFCRYDIEIVPDPLNPDPALIAEALVAGAREALGSRRKVCLKLHSIRLAVDRWLAYRIDIDRCGRKIKVEIGDVLDTGGNITRIGSGGPKASRNLPCDMVMDYGFRVDVTYLEGPTLLFVPEKDFVRSVFIHWHREWSHSLIMAITCALVFFLAAGALAGAVAGAAVLMHVAMDQAGYMGNKILFPFSRFRAGGQRLLRSGAGIWNLAVVWICILITVWNAGLHDQLDGGILPYLLRVGFLPLMFLRLVFR